jgi:hypothetical protein
LVKLRSWEKEQITKGKRDKKNQSQLLGFFHRKKKTLSMQTSSLTTEEGSGAKVDNANVGPSNSIVSNNDPNQHQVACAGAFNSVDGKKKNDILLVHKYVVICNQKFKWGMYNYIPAIMSMGCTGIGNLDAIDGGLACKQCIDLRSSKATYNSSVFLNKWSPSLKRCIKRCTKDALTELDIEDARRFLHCSDSSFNEIGRALKKETKAQVEYAKRMSMLAKSLPSG